MSVDSDNEDLRNEINDMKRIFNKAQSERVRNNNILENAIHELNSKIGQLSIDIKRLEGNHEGLRSLVNSKWDNEIKEEKKLKDIIHNFAVRICTLENTVQSFKKSDIMWGQDKEWAELQNTQDIKQINKRIDQIKEQVNERLNNLDKTVTSFKKSDEAWEEEKEFYDWCQTEDYKKIDERLDNLESINEEYNLTFKKISEITDKFAKETNDRFDKLENTRYCCDHTAAFEESILKKLDNLEKQVDIYRKDYLRHDHGILEECKDGSYHKTNPKTHEHNILSNQNMRPHVDKGECFCMSCMDKKGSEMIDEMKKEKERHETIAPIGSTKSYHEDGSECKCKETMTIKDSDGNEFEVSASDIKLNYKDIDINPRGGMAFTEEFNLPEWNKDIDPELLKDWELMKEPKTIKQILLPNQLIEDTKETSSKLRITFNDFIRMAIRSQINEIKKIEKSCQDALRKKE